MAIPFTSRTLQGYIEIIISGKGAVPLIQMASDQGIAVWQVRRRGDALVCCVLASDFSRLRPLARQASVRIHISRRHGLPFHVRGPAREVLFTGIIVFVGLLYIMGALIWTIQLSALEHIPEHEIIQALDNAGLRPGVPKRTLNLQEIERRVLAEVHWLSWVGIEVRGSVARVTLIERADPGWILQAMEPADLIAAKAGKIETLIVLEGVARVEEGQIVQAGQVLISGDPPKLTFHGRTTPPPLWPPSAVQARGIVQARVTYHVRAEVPFVLETSVRTGQSIQRSELHIGVRSLVLSGTADEPSFALYAEERNPLVWRWHNSEHLAELVSVTYYEVERIREDLGPGGARVEAEAIARRDFGLALSPGAVVVSQVVNAQELPNSVAVELLVEVIEDIAQVRLR